MFNVQPSEPLDEIQAAKALETLRHRGPDAQHLLRINAHTLFAHSRLSIIDLVAASDQPMVLGNLVIVFNGEIYNYLELRDQLVHLGYDFRTKSDTEVILVSYRHWGEDCVTRFNGMWAFAIYDGAKDALFCSRDRFGVKPFNYCYKEGRFIFASEIKAIVKYAPVFRTPNYNAIANYCRETVGAQAEETWFKDVFRLAPATNMTISSSGVKRSVYWNYPSEINTRIGFGEAVNSYRELLQDAVRIRMRSDVKVGCTLSGGLDSTTIAYEMARLTPEQVNAYTASFPGESFDEARIAQEFAVENHLAGHEVVVDYSNYVNNLKDIIYHLESGHGSPAIYPLWAVTKRARQDITVFLEGQGADELLGGYVNSVFIDQFLGLLSRGKLRDAFAELNLHRKEWPLLRSVLLYYRQTLGKDLRKLYRSSSGLEEIYEGPLEHYTPYELPRDESHRFADRLNRRLYKQHRTGLVNLLHYGDAISMMHSLENRLPFLDYRLVEFAFQLPGHFKVSHGFGKYIHRMAYREKLPAEIVFKKAKLGFVSPLHSLFKTNSFASEVLRSERLRQRGLFGQKPINNLLKQHEEEARDNSRLLFKVLSTELWFRTFADPL